MSNASRGAEQVKEDVLSLVTGETTVRFESEIPGVVGVDEAESAPALRLLGVSDRLEPARVEMDQPRIHSAERDEVVYSASVTLKSVFA